jgi:CSLREA domain-containing protein
MNFLSYLLLAATLFSADPQPSPAIPPCSGPFIVNSTADTPDASPGDGCCADASGNCTLRAAIQEANATAGRDTLQFALLPSDANYNASTTVWTISPASNLPPITDTLVVDGSSQSGYAGSPRIVLNGAAVPAPNNGLEINAPFCVVRGLNIRSFSGTQIRLNGGSAIVQGNYLGTTNSGNASASGNGPVILLITSSSNQIGGTGINQGNTIGGGLQSGSVQGRGIDILNGGSNLIQGNRIGVGADGSTAIPNQHGILISDSDGNLIGGSSAAARNVISGNQGNGILIQSISGDSRGNQVQGNYIGLNAAGTAALANGSQGLRISGNSKNSIAGPGNVISGNTGAGLYIEADSAIVQGNVVGLNAAQSAALGNSIGIYAGPFAGIRIGGSGAGEGNVVAGNGSHGMHIVGAGSGRRVQGNRVGLSASDQAFGNGPSASGILLQGASGVTVGGTASGEGNVIGGNGGAGINVNTSTGILIQGNTIGLDGSQASKRANANGILVEGAGSFASIGGTAPGAGNVISGNSNHGIHLKSSATGTSIQGNLIGTNASGASGLGNSTHGVVVENAPGVAIGGTSATARNVISGNGQYGIYVANTSACVISGNYIGTGPNGSTAVANGWAGVFAGGRNHLIGGTAAEAGNVLSGNGLIGVHVSGTGIAIEGNRIGTNAAGTAALPNLSEGVRIDSANNRVGGTIAGQGNVISGNPRGIWLNTAATGNLVQGNLIGTAANGATALPNTAGMQVEGGGNTIGGTSAAARNVISGNAQDGIVLTGSSSAGNLVQGNYIGTNSAGNAAVANGRYGVYLLNDASNNSIGGTAAGMGNLISGNTSAGIAAGGTNSFLGNIIGRNAANSANIPNGYGIFLNSAFNSRVGGTAVGAGNVIAGNNKDGVALISGAGGISILQNSFFGNGEIGIDLGDNTSNGVTPNDGAKTSGQPNLLMDYPVITSALLSGTSLFVQGYIGSTPGDSDFAGARVEIFKSDNDPSGHGEGQVYLGFLSADASGNFSGSLSVSGISPGDPLSATATATDAQGNTSEFGANRVLVKRAFVNPHLPIWTSGN